ncbi:hypothetical protein DFH07DRAFT_769636 [Mycena maculata]|uniref:Uncharacterized protein n=1 Tax=Mycena maculata TaxID=230809 RepID=A0AAD7NMP0_9AGAR|nr:hypothetical protein DFH07DRAFT_769636 [Mycena maculata]
MVLQNMKKNKDKCIQLMEPIHLGLFCIVDLHMKSETMGSLPLATLELLSLLTDIIHTVLIKGLAKFSGPAISTTIGTFIVGGSQTTDKCFDTQSNLNTSIRVSLSSPRFTSMPGAKDLLSLLSILPDGLSDMELLQSNLPIKDVLACKAVLLGTSLAFIDDKTRLKSLVPI